VGGPDSYVSGQPRVEHLNDGWYNITPLPPRMRSIPKAFQLVRLLPTIQLVVAAMVDTLVPAAVRGERQALRKLHLCCSIGSPT
jgi:hypothetical protein